MKSVFKSRILRALGQRARIARVIVAVAFAGLFTAACKDSTSPRTVTALTIISPTSPQTIPVNGTVQFTAVAKNADGDVLAVTPTWSVSGGGTISQTGLFTAGSTPGTSTISVTCSGITVTATVTVTAGAALDDRGPAAIDNAGHRCPAAVHGGGQGRKWQRRCDHARLVGR